MIDLTELRAWVDKYVGDEMMKAEFDGFLDWLKAQQDKQHRLKNSYSMPRKNAPALYTQECSCGETFSDVTEEAAQWLFDRHMPQKQGGTPRWSSSLPTESGLYWSRDLDRQPLKSDATWLERSPDGSFNWAEVFNPGNNSDVLVSRELEKREWWPIPLTAPGE